MQASMLAASLSFDSQNVSDITQCPLGGRIAPFEARVQQSVSTYGAKGPVKNESNLVCYSALWGLPLVPG